MNRDFVHKTTIGLCACPYHNSVLCTKTRLEKLYDRTIGFTCGNCSKLMCSTYRYNQTVDLCWGCGIKTPDGVLKYYVRKHQEEDDLT